MVGRIYLPVWNIGLTERPKMGRGGGVQPPLPRFRQHCTAYNRKLWVNLLHFFLCTKIFISITLASKSCYYISRVTFWLKIADTLDSGIDVPPWINAAPFLKYFNIRILIHFYIKQGIAVIFHFFFLHFFSKIKIDRCPK